ncbi:hypothetical protein ACWC2T_00220 [Streptomyces sp. NPDC001393]
MLRNLDVEFRGNGLPDELYFRLVRGNAVFHMENACPSPSGDVKIVTPRRAVEAACATVTQLGVRVLGDPALQSAVAEKPETGCNEPFLALEAAAGAACVRTPCARRRRRNSSRVLGHRRLMRLGRRRTLSA